MLPFFQHFVTIPEDFLRNTWSVFFGSVGSFLEWWVEETQK